VLDRIEALVEKIEAHPDPAVRETSRQLVQQVLTVHGAALGRVLELAREEGSDSLLERLTRDPKVEPLLLLHGLHPKALESRVERALDKVRPYLHSHGGSLELLAVEGGRVRLRLQGACTGCPSSTETLKGAIEEAVLDAAPDVAGIEVL
jgi:Fe-S cluster biogenesis protein NfuA